MDLNVTNKLVNVNCLKTLNASNKQQNQIGTLQGPESCRLKVNWFVFKLQHTGAELIDQLIISLLSSEQKQQQLYQPVCALILPCDHPVRLDCCLSAWSSLTAARWRCLSMFLTCEHADVPNGEGFNAWWVLFSGVKRWLTS